MRIGIGIEIGSGVYDAEIEVEAEDSVVLPSAWLWLGNECSSIKLPYKLCRVIERELESLAADMEADKIREEREYDGK